MSFIGRDFADIKAPGVELFRRYQVSLKVPGNLLASLLPFAKKHDRTFGKDVRNADRPVNVVCSNPLISTVILVNTGD